MVFAECINFIIVVSALIEYCALGDGLIKDHQTLMRYDDGRLNLDQSTVNVPGCDEV